ncbi:DNA adenine methylase [Pacificoceanicola onchidii]|uniref:DNA adenine methylase n=1 Tax=Pacificoceanicola onchidii TaxID=2562685 RepID=UPI0010A54F46|nr:DNA adenine methylase [Pacificoceanicola onchidii]
MTQQYVGAAAPVAPWMGGKSKLAKTLIERIERIPHQTYVEPFVGMGGVFLRRAYRPKVEVINDANGEIINLFRILQRHYPQFMDTLKYQVSSRREFERLRKCDPSTLTDLERAARFLYLQRQAFGGKVDGVFGVAVDRPSRFDITQIAKHLEAAHERLSGVVFENLDWADILARYDGRNTLFYLDPPYFGNEQDYGDAFSRDQFTLMADLLKSSQGEFVLSINDTPEIRSLFEWAVIDEVRLTYTVSREGGGGRRRELIVSKTETPAGLF